MLIFIGFYFKISLSLTEEFPGGMMEVERINDILRRCLGSAGDEGVEVVDVWQRIALKANVVRDHADDMKELLREWPPTSWGQPIPPLGRPEPITYIQAGAVLGGQSMAF